MRTTAEAEGRVGGAPPSRCDLWCTNDHSSLAITADTYTSVLPAVAQAAAEAVAGIVPRTAKKAADAGALSVGYQKAPREARMDVSRTGREAKGQVRGVGRLGFEPRTYGLKERFRRSADLRLCVPHPLRPAIISLTSYRCLPLVITFLCPQCAPELVPGQPQQVSPGAAGGHGPPGQGRRPIRGGPDGEPHKRPATVEKPPPGPDSAGLHTARSPRRQRPQAAPS